jgi:hypothetical protein
MSRADAVDYSSERPRKLVYLGLELTEAVIDRYHLLCHDAVTVSRVDPDVIEASHTAEFSKQAGNGLPVTETNPLGMALQPLGPVLDSVGAQKLCGVTQDRSEAIS